MSASGAGQAALLAVVIAAAGAAAVASGEPEEARLGPDLEVQRLRPTVWLHVSRNGQGVAANGLIVRTPRGLLLVETGWTEGQAERLLAWGERALGAFYVQALVTQAHRDRAGGLAALAHRGVPVAALDTTVDELRGTGGRLPRVLLTAARPVHADALGFEAFFPGPGPARNDVVVWLPAERVLFGGGLVESETVTDLGNVGEADRVSWSKAIEAVRTRYPRAEVVVPGSGPVGGPGALAHTLDLLRLVSTLQPGRDL